jgi:peptidoglycan-associated lipoprotein
MNKIVPALLAAMLLAACGSTPKTGGGAAIEDRTPGGATSSAADGSAPGIQTITPDATTGSPLAILKDPKSILSKRSVYFDFDSYVIKEEHKPLVEAHGKFLREHPEIKMLIQGNADERGSREYNLALGQKRAEAVRKALTLLGAKDAQIEAVSLGEEKPKNAGHDEAAWAENRRGDMLYTGEF